MQTVMNKVMGVKEDIDINKPHWKPVMMEKLGMKAAGEGINKLADETTDSLGAYKVQQQVSSGESAVNTAFNQAYNTPVNWSGSVPPTTRLAPFMYLHKPSNPDFPMTPAQIDIIRKQLSTLVPLLDDEKRHAKEISPGSLSRGVRCLTYDTSASDKLSDVTLTNDTLSTYWPQIAASLGASQPSRPGSLVRGHRKIKKLYLTEYGAIRPILRPACVSIIFTTGNVMVPTELTQFVEFACRTWPNLYMILGLVDANQSVKDHMRRCSSSQVRLVHLDGTSAGNEMATSVAEAGTITAPTANPTPVTSVVAEGSPTLQTTTSA